MALAKKHSRDGQLATAADIYARILAQFPDHKPAQRALRKLPENPKDKNNFREDMERLTALYTKGADDEALALATRLSRKYKTQPMPLNIRGAILTRRDQLDEAIATFKKGIELEPRYADLWNNLGMAYMLNDQFDLAKDCFQTVIGRNPRDVTALLNLGRIHRSDGRLEQSVNSYERALDLAPSSGEGLCGLGITLRMLGEEKASLRALRAAIDLYPAMPEAHMQFGETLMQMKMYTASLEHLRQAVELDPASPFCHYQFAVALAATGDTGEAIAHYERCLELDPDALPSARHFLAVARGENTTVAPEGYVRSLFDDYASRFEKSLVGDLGYRGPEVLLGSLTAAIGERRFSSAVDLGCGTGLMGSLVRPLTDRLTGIDLSPKMLSRAAERKVYDQLLAGEVVSTLAGISDRPDLFVCADVLVYIGDLNPLFSAVSQTAAPGAIFAITTEKATEGDYTLLSTGRYAHSDSYVERVAQQAGFIIKSIEEAPLRKERTEWLTGGYYVLQAAG